MAANYPWRLLPKVSISAERTPHTRQQIADYLRALLAA
jgi:hypothetical protein